MIALTAQTKIFLAAEPTDMRKGFDGLYGLVTGVLQQDSLTGHLSLFINRRRGELKVFYWDGEGLAIWYRRLEQGTFQLPKLDADTVAASISSDDLMMLLRGVDYSKVRRRKRFVLAE